MPDTTTTEEPALEIIFRYLILLFNSPQGLKVLVPRKHHRTVLRDMATDMRLPLSQASVRLEIDGAADPAERTTLVPKDLLVSLERPLKLTTPISPHESFLAAPAVAEALNALVELPGGTITAYPSEAFPEKAEDPVTFDFGESNVFTSRVTDTTFYKKALPATAGKIELVVTTPRRVVRIDITKGGRFELRNEDEKFGPTPDMNEYHAEELQEVLFLINEPALVQCDTFSCGTFYCGDEQGIFYGE